MHTEAPPRHDDLATAGDARAGATPATLEERALPTQVSAAWELELLIAGAVTFALLQLPDEVAAMRDWIAPQLGSRGTEVALMLLVGYLNAALYVLIFGFVVNLSARAYWVGLVGLHSVYPRGVRWEQLEMGPVATSLYRRRVPSLTAVIARVDNFASIIFSFTFLAAVTVATTVIGFVFAAGLAWLLARYVLRDTPMTTIIYTIVGLLVLPGSIAAYVDKRMGRRLDPASGAYRGLELAMRSMTWLAGNRLVGPISFTLMSNGGRRRVSTYFFVGVMIALVVSFTQQLVVAGLIGSGGGPAWLPGDPDIRGVHADHYESLVTPSTRSRTPTIQSDVVEGPYVRLFVPFRDDRAEYAMSRRCAPDARAGARPNDTSTVAIAQAADRSLDCLAQLYDVRLDGAPVPGLRFRYYQHPISRVHGMIGYVPAGTLAPGAHALRLTLPGRPPEPNRAAGPAASLEIPFWR